MASFSFDVSCQFDQNEISNLFYEIKKQIANRYDFKNTSANLDWLDNKSGFKITGDNHFQVESIEDLIRKRLASRHISQHVMDFSQEIKTNNMKNYKQIVFKETLTKDETNQIAKKIREQFKKIKITNQNDSLRIVSNSKDELQDVIKFLQSTITDMALQFTNFK